MTEYRRDAAGQDVKVGDLVVYVRPYTHTLEEGYIIRFTGRGFTMGAEPTSKSGTNRKREQVIKLPLELRLERLLD